MKTLGRTGTHGLFKYVRTWARGYIFYTRTMFFLSTRYIRMHKLVSANRTYVPGYVDLNDLEFEDVLRIYFIFILIRVLLAVNVSVKHI
jgi:hypothetical protein